MSMIPKETDSNFGQEEQRPNVCDSDAQGGFFIDYMLAVAGELQRASHSHTTSSQSSNSHFHPCPDCKPVTGTIDNENSANDAHTYTRR